MPEVTVDNPTVAVDLSPKESFTVPSNTTMKVTIMSDPNTTAKTRINGADVLVGQSGNSAAVKTVLVSGDTVETNGTARIRGFEL